MMKAIKKITRNLSHIFLLSSIFSFYFILNNHFPVYADSVHLIGSFYLTQMVNSITKVYVFQDSLQWAIDCGRTIYQELEPLQDPIEEQSYYLLNSNPNFAPPLIRYFYYATPTEPKITGKRQLYNDVDSLVFVLSYMESACSQYNVQDYKNAILGYVRGINTRYVGSYLGVQTAWTIVCGNHQSTLSSILNSMYAGGGIRINEYFSSFVGHNEYNSSEYGFCSSTYLDNHFNIIDPLTGNDCIDLVHLFASLDGIFENTGETTQNLTIFDYLTKDTFRYLVSWGGDLQSVAHQVQDSGMSDFDFYDVLLQNNNFSFYDFYADVDATNIATRLSLNNCGEISQLISSYYQGLINENFDRNTLFVEKIASTANPNYSYLSNESAFLSITADILKMDGNLNDCFPVVYDTIKYHLLKKNTFPYNYPNHQTRFNLEIAFLEYFGIMLYE